MTPVTRKSSLAHKVQPNHDPKLTLLELRRDRRPTLFQTQTKEFSKLSLNHSTPYIYIINDPTVPANHCTPYTYTKNLAKLPLTLFTSYTYIKDCALCVLIHRQESTLPKPLTHPPKCAKSSLNCATGGPPVHPNLRFHSPKPPSSPCQGAPPPNPPTCSRQDCIISGPPFCADPLNFGREK